MAQKPALLQRAQQKVSGFKRPDVKPLIPPDMVDVVDRVTAAGMRYLYSPAMREEVMQAIQSQEPVPQKLGNNVTGLLLTLDNQTKGGIPQAALFPAGIELLGEAAEMLVASGQPVTQEDFNTAGLTIFATLAKKLGASDQDVMAAAQQQVGQGAGQPADPQAAEAAEGEEPMDDEMPENVA